MASPSHQHLKQSFAITPKTVGLLLSAGYKDYRELQNVSPNQLVAQFAKQPGMDMKSAKPYGRAFRRMVWLATQDNPEKQAKVCKDWTNKALMAKGVWVNEFDDLTGRQINDLFKKATKKKTK